MENKLIRTGLPIRPEIYSSASGSYGIRLDALENERQAILDYFNSKGKHSDAAKWFETNYINARKGRECICTHPSCRDYVPKCRRLQQIDKDKAQVIEEMKKEEQYLKDQELIQQQQQTEAAKAAVEKALAEIEAAKNKTAQELAKAQQELAKAQAAQQLAESGRTDDAARLLGQDVKSYKGLVIGGIILGALGVGFVVYKMLAKKKVV